MSATITRSRSPNPNLESLGEAPSTSRTDDVHREYELVRRWRGRLGLPVTMPSGLKAAYFKAIPERFASPKQVADEIRRLLGHDKSTIYQRHRRYNHGYHSFPHHDEVVSLCTRLIKLSRETTTELAARRELLALSVEDPVVFGISPIDLSLEYGFLGTQQDGENCHRRWSELLGRSTFKSNQHSETAQCNCDALKDTFYTYNRAAIKYIPYAMGLEMQNDDLVLLHQLWLKFLNYVYTAFNSEARFASEFLDLCLRNIVSSGKPLAFFASPSQLERIAMPLITHSIYVPFVFSTFFPPPRFEPRNPKEHYGAKLTIHSPARKWDIVTASTYAIPFLGAYAGGEYHTLSEFIEGEYGRGTPLERTVFAKPESTFIELYKTVYDAAIRYRRSKGVLSIFEESVHGAVVTLVEPSLKTIVTGKQSRNGKKNWDIPRSNFIIAHTIDIDRYHKHEMFERFKKNDAYIDVLNDRLRFHTYYQRLDGICNLTYIPQFQNVSYLRRFRIGNEYFITADGLPESSNQNLNYWNRAVFPEDIVVDTMASNGKFLTCLRVRGECWNFHCTEHYPILAGLDFETGEALYVAVVYQGVDSPWYFTTIKDGASSVTYTDEVGEEHVTNEFFVLALRHDPMDLPSQNTRQRAGAKDPTGPVYWVEFWPKKDAHNLSEERLKDDRNLQEFLERLRERKTDPEECQLQELLSGF